LANSLNRIVENSTHGKKLNLLCAHPQLCVKASSPLSTESKYEQKHAGLDTLSKAELSKFTKWNVDYEKKFCFPFILAVRNATKHTVLSAIEGRMTNSREVEFLTAMAQVHKIAWMRLLNNIIIDNPKGSLTTHVLDTSNGCAASQMRVQLYRIDRKREFLSEFYTNDDGRLDGPVLKGSSFQVGVYELTFFVGDYFAGRGGEGSSMPFLNEIPIRFGIDDPEEHYHVPLLVTPWSFSTYRGS